MIYDRNGSLVWIGSAEFGPAFDLQMQAYRGRQVLTTWNGTITDSGHGIGTCWIFDDTYRVIESINSVGGADVDLHECHIPKDTESTAMITVYNDITGFDLSSFGGPVNGTLVDCWVQEIDIATGHVLFNWSMFEHVSPYDSFAVPGDGTSDNSTWDAYHMNSIDKAADGNYLISSRHLHQLLFIDKHHGSLIWRMGGKTSNFTIGEGAQFEWQHHARFNPEDNTRISLFDDGAATWAGSVDEPIAHGLYISYDTSSWTVTKLQEFFPEPFQNFSVSQGSMQRFSDGTAVVGFGSNPWITEHASNGSVTFSLSLGDGSLENGPIQNYRAFKVDWTGNPTKPPALALQNNTAFFSWNGKTAVRSYDILGGASPNNLHTRASVNRAGFETSASLAHFSDKLIAVLARDKHGVKLGTSAVLHVANGTVAVQS
ncbi:ASST-domain-containing protein [Mycena epipterygia]|nr:ASST-domain-containing protein [Mycena epipterygia]